MTDQNNNNATTTTDDPTDFWDVIVTTLTTTKSPSSTPINNNNFVITPTTSTTGTTTSTSGTGVTATSTQPIYLEDVFFSFGIGCIILAITLFLFAIAIRCRSTHIAPRTEARPRNVIYNVDANKKTNVSNSTNSNNCSNDNDYEQQQVQNRGNPFCLGWIGWIMKLSYHTMLQGVPGTGTRNNGLDGSMLRVNLDNIVILRFHSLCLRIAIAAMLIYCGCVWPIYITARCFEYPFAVDGTISSNCTDKKFYNLTNYQRLTLANIPPLQEIHYWDSRFVTLRLYAVVFAVAIVSWYTCYQLHREWISCLAMRRVYYLEYDHWQARREETRQTMLNVARHDKHHKSIDNHYRDCGNPHLHKRQAWIPHPEQRDTPPNIGLYSVLVAGLPSRPVHVNAEDDIEEAIKNNDDNNEEVDWQLAVTAAFFDYAVPNTPGFSSSVAAVSILPSAEELKVAWQKFYKATNRLTRLRFIRSQLAKRRAKDLEKYDEVLSSTSGDLPQSPVSSTAYDVYLHSSRRLTYQMEMLGVMTDEAVEELFLGSLELGPEQTSVYSREVTRGAAGCCPHGCCEQRMLWKSIEELKKAEADAIQEAIEAFAELELARKEAALAQENTGTSRHRSSMLNVECQALETRLFDKGKGKLHESREKNERSTSPASRKSTKTQTSQERVESNGHVNSTTKNDINTSESDSIDLNSPNGNHEPSSVLDSLQQSKVTFLPSVFRPKSLAREESKLNLNDDEQERKRVNEEKMNPWDHVEQLAIEAETGHSQSGILLHEHIVTNGAWNFPTLRHCCFNLRNNALGLFSWTLNQSGQAVDVMARDSTVAVVTFTRYERCSTFLFLAISFEHD